MKNTTVAIALGVVALAGLAALGVLRGSWTKARGDEGTYLAMAESLARDGDLRFDERDLARVRAAGDPGRQELILQQTRLGVSYSKPVAYALLAAPFSLALGSAGPFVCNALLLAGALLLAAAYLRRLGSPAAARLTLVTFAGASVLAVYLAWRMSDLAQAALALAGLVLCLAAERGPAGAAAVAGKASGPARGAGRGRADRWLESRAAPWIGGALLGLLVSLRYPNGLVAAAPIAALLLLGRWRKAVAVAVALVVAFGAMSGASRLLLGTSNPYKAERASFTAATGYPAGTEAETARLQFVTEPKTSSIVLAPDLQPGVSAYSALYFLVGRHTGLLVYFPALLALLWPALRWPDRIAAPLLLAALACAVFYLVWLPRNYFGGGAFVGNRYFLSAYPLLLVALPRLPRRRLLLLPWTVALAGLGSALVSTAATRQLETTSQSHAHAGLFRLLPYESTAPLIEGRRDRYWQSDFLRFVDPWAEVGADGFRLAAGSPPAEILIAGREAPERLLFRVTSAAPRLELEVGDRQGRRRLPLAPLAGKEKRAVAVELAPAWRRHPFWWAPEETVRARAFRLALRTPDGSPAEGRLRYAGDAAALDAMFVCRVLSAPLPRSAVAGSTTTLPLRLQNMSHILWTRDGVLPVEVGYRLLSHDPSRPPTVGRRQPLPHDLPSGDVARVALPVAWPLAPGAYRLVVDLRVDGVGWFAERVGRPLAQGRVEVVVASR